MYSVTYPGTQLAHTRYVGMTDLDERAKRIDAAIERIAHYNEQPMAMLHPMIPHGLIQDNFDMFRQGLLTPQEFAQRLQNTISLWLIE